MANSSIFDRTIKFSKNQIVYSPMDDSNSFFYILNGKVNLYEIRGHSKIFYKSCPIMSTFGVDEFITEDGRKYMAIATENSEFLQVNNENIEEFSTQLPNVVLNILSKLSNELKNLNDLILLKENHSCDPICHGELNFISDENHTYIESDRKYPVLLADVHKNYLYEADRTCPVCTHTFISNSVRLSHMIFLSEDEDLRIHYQDINPLWYQLLTCPKCKYVNFRQTFSELKSYLIDTVKDSLKELTSFEPTNIKVSINDVFEEYYHFLKIIDKYNYSELAKSRVWESLMWLYDDVGDIESYKKAKEKYNESLKAGWYSDSDNLSSENESLITYKVSLLELEKGNLKEAHMFCMRALRVKGISTHHKRRVQNKLYEISELNRKQHQSV